MADDYQAASERGRSRDPRDYRREQDYEDFDDRPETHYRSRQAHGLSLNADFPTERRGYSRSSSRQGSPRASQEQRSWEQDEMARYNYRSYNHRGGGGNGPPRRDGDSHHAGRRSAEDRRDYSGMYDERPPREGGQDDRRGRSRDNRRRSRGRSSRRSRSPGRGGNSRSRSTSSTRGPGRPTDTVIIEGLPLGPSAAETQRLLLNTRAITDFQVVEVRVPPTSGTRRAFVQFQDVEKATAFVDRHFPTLLIPLEHPTDEAPDGTLEAYLHFARNRVDNADAPRSWANSADWTCVSCNFSNFASREVCKSCGTSKQETTSRVSLTGWADAATVVMNQFLVVYPLPSTMDEEMFAREMKQLELQPKPQLTQGPDAAPNSEAPKLKPVAPSSDPSRYGARPGSIHRVFVMRDSQSDVHYQYGFVEFWTIPDATAALNKVKVMGQLMVASHPSTLAPIHFGVFVPEVRPLNPTVERMSFFPLFNPQLRVRYRDDRVYPSRMIVNAQPPVEPEAQKPKPPDDESSDKVKKGTKRKGMPLLGNEKMKKPAPAPMAGQMAIWQKKHQELIGIAHDGAAKEGNSSAIAKTEAGQVKASKPAFKKDGPIKFSIPSTLPVGAPADSGPGDDGATAAIDKAAGEDAKDEGPKEELYTDRSLLQCLLCWRKYKSLEELMIHEKSRNHRTAMEDGERVKVALPRIAKRDQRERDAQENTEVEGPKYRDRAKERREAQAQLKKHSAQDKAKADAKMSKENAAAPAKPAQSKGADMLAKMGWKAGGGLGANGEGRTEVITTNAYQEGVGLGAEGGVLGDAAEQAEKNTKGDYSTYLSTAQDKARERFQKLQ